MHRFTRGGLQTSLGDSREWMISRVCEALLDEKVFSNEDWISLSDDSPLFEGCPFDRFSEDDIVALLQRHPEHAHRFDVDGLANMKRAHLFAVRPELVGEHSLDGLGSGALWWILAAQPGLAGRMRLKLITPEDWSFLLVRQPQLAELCDMRRFSPRDWSRLLQARPEFASVCDFAGFSEANWVDLIIEQPSFADRVDMEEFSCENLRQILWFQPQLGTPSMLCRLPDYDFERVLSKHLELVRLCDTAGFSAKRWAEILGSSENPKAGVVADLCGRVDMGGATAAEWHELLCTMLKKKGEVYQGWSPENLSIFMDWAIREVRGALVRYDNREKLMLATVFPELLAHCEYNLFDVEDWALALAVDPKLAGTCDFSRFGRIDWMTLLMLCPEFEDRCDFSLFISDDWAVLLAKDFRFAAHCDVSRLDGRFWTMYARAVQAIAASGEMWYGHPDLNVDGLVGALPELLTRYDFSKVDEYLLKLPDGDKWRDAGYRLGRGFGIFARQKRERYVFFDETEHEGSFVHPSSAEAIYDVTSQCLAGICPEIFDFTRLQNQWCIEAVAATLLRNPEGERLLERFDWSQVDASTRKAWHDAGVDVGG